MIATPSHWRRPGGLLGGIDVDFLCRSDEPAIRRRVRDTIDACLPGGGWCLGTGNTAANYIPVDNYLAMIDEGPALGGVGPARRRARRCRPAWSSSAASSLQRSIRA